MHFGGGVGSDGDATTTSIAAMVAIFKIIVFF